MPPLREQPAKTAPSDMETWLQSLPADRQSYIAGRYQYGYDTGFEAGQSKATHEMKLNGILIPLAIVAFPLGIAAQRLLNLVN